MQLPKIFVMPAFADAQNFLSEMNGFFGQNIPRTLTKLLETGITKCIDDTTLPFSCIQNCKPFPAGSTGHDDS